ncbi:MAG TPA: shikimate kinase [Candidatus Eisenbacteria bacterium]|nr:shikimate kinase [Candidatus Eisenbacteria bacterium]
MVSCGAFPRSGGPRCRRTLEDRLTAWIALIGLSGAGKTEVAPLVASRLGLTAVDLDALVERETGTSVAALIETRGESAFRAAESGALRDALSGEGTGRSGVIAIGAGALGSAENRERLRAGAFVVWLRVEPRTAARRVGPGGAEARPLVREEPERKLRELLEARAGTYRAAADAEVDTEGRTIAEVAEAVVAAWEAGSRWGSSAS